jgi:hypothetical protein
MNTKLFFCILILVFAFSCRSGVDSNASKEELREVWSGWYNALAKKDLAGMKELTTSNFIMYDNGVVYNNESALRSLEGMDNFTATFKFDSLNTHIEKLNASAYCQREATFTMNDSTWAPVHFLESATFRKEDNKWKLRFLHSSLKKL